MADEFREIKIHGNKVRYNQETRSGMKRLSEDLDYDETKPLFEYAKRKSQAHFETDNEGQYTLLYDKSAHTYTIVKRKH